MRLNANAGSAARVTLPIRARAIARHFWQKLIANSLGRLFVSPAGSHLRARLAALRAPVSQPTVSVAIIAHVYYLDLLQEILKARDVLAGEVPVHLTTPFDRVDELRRLVADVPAVTIHPCENRGRDIAPFLSVLQSGALDEYDAVLKLHTKRSPHLIDGDIRRKLLYAMLCGERNATFRMLKLFEDQATGMVGWGDCFRTDEIFWMKNYDRVNDLAKKMQAQVAIRLGFFEGSMFWFRPSAFAPLRKLALKTADFEAEAGQLDGTIHHAIERCFTIAAWSKGYVVRDMKGRLL